MVNLCLRSTNYIINSVSNRFNFVFAIQIGPNLIICVDKFFKFLLQTIILIIQIGHMLV